MAHTKNKTKGIVLAGGTGSRLFPITMATNKHLLPVFDKPMLFYPLSTLMLGGIRDILLITDEEHLPSFKALLADGSPFGISITYATQDQPNGIPEAFLIGEDFIGNANVVLILADNIFYGRGLGDLLLQRIEQPERNCIFVQQVNDPERYGVINISKDGEIISVVEKPSSPTSDLAITGLYHFDASVVEIAKQLKVSRRGELEITDVIQAFIDKKKLDVCTLGRGFAWLDTGTAKSLIDASQFVSILMNRQGVSVGCLEEIAFDQGWLTKQDIISSSERYGASVYGQYIRSLINR